MTSTPLTLHVLATKIIQLLQTVIADKGFDAKVHFELEGCYQNSPSSNLVDFSKLNQWLALHQIEGEIIPEYWQNQWEFVSAFAGQSPLKEAKNLAFVMNHLSDIFRQLNYGNVCIKPVVWSGDQGKMAQGSTQIMSQERRAVHIPNAIQMNVSVLRNGENLMVKDGFGELLQQSFLKTSLGCCLLYLPEEEAFERFALKTQYGLFDELCSPYDISGGHQGSIALYKDKGKHNQAMGVEPLIYGLDEQILISEQNWHTTARIEHRLGAASQYYNPQVNVIFALLNIIECLDIFESTKPTKISGSIETPTQVLPISLYDQKDETNSDYGSKQQGAISLFENDEWFSQKIDQIVQLQRNEHTLLNLPINSGQILKQQILANYLHQPVITNRISL